MSHDVSPDATFPCMPADDPYAHHLIQFGVLRGLGYPVDIELLSADQARPTLKERLQDPNLGPWYSYQLERFRRWGRPVILNSDFCEWVADLDFSIELPELPLSRQRALEGHPALKLPAAVDGGHYPVVRNYLASVRQQRPVMVTPGAYGGVFRSCYVAAVDRFTERRRIAPNHLDVIYAERLARPSDGVLYKKLREAGVQPVAPEAIGAMINDFYLMLGAAVPAFAAFRETAKN